MQLDKDAPKSMDLSYEVPPEGTYTWQIMEGIDRHYNENSGKTTLKIPLKVDQVVEGDPEAVGMTANHFVPIETAFGEKQLVCLLSITGLIEQVIQKFGAEVNPLDDKFLAGLKLKLPGKFIEASHEVRENNKGQKNANFTNFSEVGQKTKAGGQSQKPPAQEQPDEAAW